MKKRRKLTERVPNRGGSGEVMLQHNTVPHNVLRYAKAQPATTTRRQSDCAIGRREVAAARDDGADGQGRQGATVEVCHWLCQCFVNLVKCQGATAGLSSSVRRTSGSIPSVHNELSSRRSSVLVM